MTRIPVTAEVWVDGVRLADGATASDTAAPIALDELTVHWGRSTTVDQPDPATCQVTLLDRGGGPTRIDALVLLGSLLVVWCALAGDRRVVFAGRVTDLQIRYEDDAGGATMQIVAADLLADLANRYVGAEPWPAEALSARAGRILTAVGVPAAQVTVDTRPAALPISRVDVDRQAAAGLLRQLAASGSAVAWVIVPPATPGTPKLRIEDPAARVSMWVLGKGTDNLYRPMPSPTAGEPVDSCAVRRDPVRWTRSTADLITRTAVRWLDQSSSPATTERSVAIVDTAAEAALGARGLSLSTILSTEVAATAAAQLLMAGHSPSAAWRADGIVWDTDATVTDDAPTRALILNLLDNTARIGRALRVGPLPWWTPNEGSAGLYAEGGTYRFVGGRWVLDLDTTSGIGAGGSLTYVGTPRSIRYQDFAPEVSYLDLIGVSAPPAGQIKAAHAEQPADDRGLGAGVEPLSHTNAYGLPVPDATDAYKDTPAALGALATAVNARLAATGMVWVAGQQYVTDQYGDIYVNLSTQLATIAGAVLTDFGPSAWSPHFYQVVSNAGQPGVLKIRNLRDTPPAQPIYSTTVQFAACVWGTPK